MIYEFAGCRWTKCDNCGDIISGKEPTKKDIQRAAGTSAGIAYPVYSMCKVCAKYREEKGA